MKHQPKSCPHCHGTGSLLCAACNGTGYIHDDDEGKSICSLCLGTGEISCHYCSGTFYVRDSETFIAVHGRDADEVQQVALAMMDKGCAKHRPKNPSPLASGAFYLIVLIFVLITLLIVAKTIPIFALPLVFIGAILALSVIGAFQLRHDGKLNQKSFLELIALSFKYLPWLRKRDTESGTTQNTIED